MAGPPKWATRTLKRSAPSTWVLRHSPRRQARERRLVDDRDPPTDAASRLAPPFQSCSANHIERLSRIPHANEPHVEIPLAAPAERDGPDAAELPGHARPVPCLVKGPVRLGAAHHHYPSVGDRVAGAPSSIPRVQSRGDCCDQRHDDEREPKPEGKPEDEDHDWRDADEPGETHEQRERRTEELDRGIGSLVGIAELGQDGSQGRGSLTPHEPLLRPKVWLNQILRAVADHCDQCLEGSRESCSDDLPVSGLHVHHPRPWIDLVIRRLAAQPDSARDRKSTRLNSSHLVISYAVFCLKKKNNTSHCS